MNTFKLTEFENEVRKMFADRLSKDICYHDLNHTLFVVEKVKEIGDNENIDSKEMENLYFAAWIHDIGYCENSPEGHENLGAQYAQEKLTEMGISQDRIDQIKEAILATSIPQNPSNKIGEILCDADLYHLGVENFEQFSELLRCEVRAIRQKEISKEEWMIDTLNFLSTHKYFTGYAQEHLSAQKEKNIASLKQKINNMESLESKPKPVKKKGSKRGTETMYRVTTKNHLELSGLADNKANIMISVNSIILSIIVSVLIRKLEEFPNFIIPTVLMVLTCLIAMVYAILATRPKVTKGHTNQEDIDNRKGNLLYFGNFYEMTEEEYLKGMRTLRNDGEYLYDSLSRDIYFLGKVLAKKYQLLRKSYSVFMFGFILSVISFLIAALFFDPYSY